MSTDLSSGYTDQNGQWVEATVPVETAYDGEKTPGLQPGVPTGSEHQPTQELFTDKDGQPVYADVAAPGDTTLADTQASNQKES